MRAIKVLSLFDGISCARVALDRLGYEVEYYASEIDKYAISVALRNYPDTIQLGSVTEFDLGVVPGEIDLLIGGSPCQDLSIAKSNRKGLDGERSGLFWKYVEIWKAVKPKYFVLENVNSMPKDAKRIITEVMGVEPIMINAALVSAQNRKRLFWTNLCVDALGSQTMPLPEDRGILLKDVLESGEAIKGEDKAFRQMIADKAHPINATYGKSGTSKAGVQYSIDKGQRTLVAEPIRIGQLKNGGQGDRVYSEEGKSVTLSANSGGTGAKTGLYAVGAAKRTRDGEKRAELSKEEKANSLTSVQTDSMVSTNYTIRKLTPVECERLQSLPDGYTEGISNTQRYRCLGNAFNVEVVRHILSFMEFPEKSA